jgi:hypothetical protein
VARKNVTAKSTVDVATMDDTVVATTISVDENMKEDYSIKTKKTVVEPLKDFDEIEITALIPNISYKDSNTGDFYKWEEVGSTEFMTFETLKNMNRNHKDYFRNMLLKPNDDRVIAKFGLTGTYDKYEFLMDEANYTKSNVTKVCDTIRSMPNGMKFSIYNKIKDFVVTGKVSDITVIRTLEKQFNLDLISFLG